MPKPEQQDVSQYVAACSAYFHILFFSMDGQNLRRQPACQDPWGFVPLFAKSNRINVRKLLPDDEPVGQK